MKPIDFLPASCLVDNPTLHSPSTSSGENRRPSCRTRTPPPPLPPPLSIRSIITLILSTDITLHDNYMDKYIQEGKSKIGVMMLILKLADVSHPLRPFHVHLYWVFNHHRENHTGLTSVQDIAKDTLWFYKRFVEPMLFIFNKHFGCPFPEYLKNKQEWKSLLASDVGA